MKTHAEFIACIDDVVTTLVDRLNAKQPMYRPDAEWTALQNTCEALHEAKRQLIALAETRKP